MRVLVLLSESRKQEGKKHKQSERRSVGRRREGGGEPVLLSPNYAASARQWALANCVCGTEPTDGDCQLCPTVKHLLCRPDEVRGRNSTSGGVRPKVRFIAAGLVSGYDSWPANRLSGFVEEPHRNDLVKIFSRTESSSKRRNEANRKEG